MNEFEKFERLAKDLREIYPKGTRLVLLQMNDPYEPIPSGMRGTVDYIDDQAQINMKWDNGRTLPIVPTVDAFRKLTEQELAEEQMVNRSKIVGKSTSLTTDSGYGCFEGYTTSNIWNGWQCPLFNKENADKICKAYNDEFCHMRYDAESDCFVAEYPVDEYTENYEGKDYIVNGKVEHLYAIGSHEWCWAMAEQEEIEDENNAICVEETTDELIEESEPTMTM